MKVAVIADNLAVQRFALDALDRLEGADAIHVVSCTNSRRRKQLVKHGAYYALNLLSVRNPLTRNVPLANGTKAIADCVEFESLYEGAWQVLPPAIIDRLRDGGFDVILKFGMGLLRVPPPEQLATPILSYHHGDPDHYRGRPAGFWEMADGAPVMGQIVQIIGNRLDAGRVVAFAETKVMPWSYRATLVEAFRHSPLIINAAVRNAIAGVSLPKASTGRNCRLPSNLTVTRAAARMGWKFLRRLAYGAAVEKAWRVSTAAADQHGMTKVLEGSFPPAEQWKSPAVAPGYSFYADPFFSHEPPGILVEALSARTGLGEIVLVTESGSACIAKGSGHMSYPATVDFDGRQYVIAETAGWSPPVASVIEQGRLEPRFELRIEGNPRLLDPTVTVRDGRFYLFGNIRPLGSSALWLWSADRLDGEFRLHPASPVRVSPRGGRMGGRLVQAGERLIRLGQDFSGGYGDGLIAFEVTRLDAESFVEHEVGAIRLGDRKGPHTLDFQDGEMVFDWYVERAAPLAGVRRLAARLRR